MFISENVEIQKNGNCIIYENDATSEGICGNGHLFMNYDMPPGSNMESIIRLNSPSAKLSINGKFYMYCGSYFDIRSGTLTVGDDSFINTGTRIFVKEAVDIGNHVWISFNCFITDTNAHTIIEDGQEVQKNSPVVIEDNVWICAHSTILKGVRIGKNSIVASNSVVTKDVPANCMVAGNPARVVKTNVTWKA